MSKVLDETVKPKRGRKPKKDILTNLDSSKKELENNVIFSSEQNIQLQISTNNAEQNDEKFINLESENENLIIKSPGKKRGRKPKGGKIIQQNFPLIEQKETKPNVILHLKCSLKDLQASGDYNSNFTSSNIESYTFERQKNECFYEIINKPDEDNVI